MDFSTAPEIVVSLQDRIDQGVFGYTAYSDAFYDAVVSWCQGRQRWSPQREWIFVNSGVMPSINLLIQTFTNPGDGVMIQPPVFHPIPEAATNNGRRPVNNALTLKNGRYQIDLVHLEKLAADPTTRMMILCSPHNPVGRVWTRDELTTVAEICSNHDVLMVSDEIHADLTYPWAEFTSAGRLESELRSNVIICAGPSKAFNLPGLKLSLTIIPDAGLRQRYEKALRNLNELWSANIMGATALQAAYRKGGDWLDGLLEYLAESVRYVERFIAARIPQLSLARPDGLYLLWIDCRELGLRSDEIDRRLRKAGLWVELGNTYGEEGEGFIRMTIACPRSTLEEAMHRMEVALVEA